MAEPGEIVERVSTEENKEKAKTGVGRGEMQGKRVARALKFTSTFGDGVVRSSVTEVRCSTPSFFSVPWPGGHWAGPGL